MKALLELKNLTKNYWDTNEKNSRPFLFAHITATIQSPERIALLGKSGQGKSTLLRVLALLESIDSGEVRLKGLSTKDIDTRAWRMNIAYVAQQSVMLPGTIMDNLTTVSNLHNRAFDESSARCLMKDVGLEHLEWGKQAIDLSGGEKQRVALVRSLLLKPSILLLDEVTASLDQQSKEYVEQLLLKLHMEEATSFIWVTHDTEQAKKISERIWYMEDGKLTIDTKTKQFFENRNSVCSVTL
ncbi:ATP-binding cassette domain-containing protein [Psychrobacillus glaciei]|uniref:ATP-binding cassette domain-containing protein n=1 Tax=Psychrobacillus glaciei TaxID=2283160 RepID=A0A5J6SRF1_9BACI|nr:ATP-binding cassette domain-containing protein [Psychrobacillus glaciei]QFG00064.1 ATP-binding cassette domain-containing protein [Psychrobacillus glaciei]